MTEKEIQNAEIQTLLNEYKKYSQKEKDVKQQLKAINDYLAMIDTELNYRNEIKINNGEKAIEKNWLEWRAKNEWK